MTTTSLTSTQRLADEQLSVVLECVAGQHQLEVQRWQALAEYATHYRAGTGLERQPLAVLEERFLTLGGEGTPAVSEFAALELGAALTVSELTAHGQLAAALDLWHRFPLTRELFAAGRMQGWVCRKVMEASRCLSLAAATFMDERFARRAGSLPPARQLALAEALVVEAEPELDEARRRRYEQDRFVEIGQLRGGGVGVSARLDLLDARRLDAAADRVADVLAESGTFARFDKQALRAHALGVLADPARTLQLLHGAAQPALDDPNQLDDPHQAGPAPLPEPWLPHLLHPSADDAPALDDSWWGALLADDPPPPDDPDEPPSPQPTIGQWRTAVAPAWVRAADEPPPIAGDPDNPWASLPIGGSCDCSPGDAARRSPVATTVTLVVHLSSDTADEGVGVARVEDLGPVRFEQLVEQLRDCMVKVQPVIDLPGLPAADRYEIPDRTKHALWQRDLYESFPGSSRRLHSCDIDHIVPWRPGGPPGQTHTGNLSGKSRRAHRGKTAGYWRNHPVSGLDPTPTAQGIAPTMEVWTSPLGRRYLVGPFGSEAITAA